MGEISVRMLVVLLLPMVFMFHDFEEVIFMEGWYKRRRGYLQKRMPKVFPRVDGMMSGKSSAGFAFSVALMFLLVCGSTLFSVFTSYYLVWWGAFLVFSLHLLMHIGQSLAAGCYVPAVVTSVVCLAYSVWGFMVMRPMFSLGETVAVLGIGIPVAGLYLWFAHWAAGRLFSGQ